MSADEILSEAALLTEMLARNDARALLDWSVSGLHAGNLDRRLEVWLAVQLERVLTDGEDASAVFKLANPEGAPLGKHGSRRASSEQIAALTVLACRRFKKKKDAYSAVAHSIGWKDCKRVQRNFREGGYEPVRQYDDALLLAMIGDELLVRMRWEHARTA